MTFFVSKARIAESSPRLDFSPMKNTIVGTLALLSAIAIANPIQAENLNHLNQLLGSKKCSQCDLSSAGLVLANLAGADLTGANLVNANLSQANLTGANLTGANLTGASLFGANLSGAILTDATLTGTDLRNAYLLNAQIEGVDLNSANLNGVKGISLEAGTAEQFHRWGVRENERGNYRAAIAHYHRAINLDPEFAPAYLGLGVIYYKHDEHSKAIANTELAVQLFEEQENQLGHQSSSQFLENMELALQIEADIEKRERGAANVGKFMGGVGSLLLQLLL
ncbi:putative low-complexity protein [Xenococcus sp. PCC 7305]|nr:putative low-complexity protein [Xenococcus sp. PCC 7305]